MEAPKVLGEKSIAKRSDWSDATQTKIKNLIDLADCLTPTLGDVVGVQLYTLRTDAINKGNTLTLIFKDGKTHTVNTPKDDLALARDSVRDAIIAELN